MRLVVIGGVAAGLSAASRARRIDPRLEILVLEKGRRISYGACGLPYWIEGQVRSLDELTVYTPQFFRRERNIEVRTEAEAIAVQHGRREVLLASGERVKYDKLVWAAGARPVRWDSPRAFTLHTDVDAERLQEFLREKQPRTAAVVGGGYIGLEMATALRARGLAVTLYHDGPNLMNRECAWLTGALLYQLDRNGIKVEMHARVPGPDAVNQDLIITALGLKPNVQPPCEAGAELGRTGALRTDDRMETTLMGVYAAGDCAETTHLVSGRPAWLPLGTTANKMGRVAGANAAGRRERFPGITGASIVRVGGWAVGVTGFSETQARREGFQPVVARISGRDKPKYFFGRSLQVELVADRNTRRLIGGVVLGEDGVLGRLNTVTAALTGRLTIDQFAELDLAYAPPYAPAMDPLLIAAQQLLHLLD